MCATSGLPSTPSYVLHNTTRAVARTLLLVHSTDSDNSCEVEILTTGQQGDDMCTTLEGFSDSGRVEFRLVNQILVNN